MIQTRSQFESIRVVFLALGVVALSLVGVQAAQAQVTGKVIGTVTDSQTAQPLVGAQVIVDGTNLGNITNEDGYYFINNVPVGVQRITAQYLGYQTTTQEQRILAGQTMTTDFAMNSEVVQADAIVAVIEREPLVARDNTISKVRFTGEDARELPVNNITEVITLGAGVHLDIGRCISAGSVAIDSANDGCGFVVRGGRQTETAVMIDGALVTDFTSQISNSDVGNFAVEEVDVITGGFNAEFGNAQSGIVNIVTREGGREYHGHVRFTTDELAPEQSYGYNNLQASFGGPIIPDRLTFFGSFEATGADDFEPRIAGFNPAQTPAFTVAPDGTVHANTDGSTEEILPGNRGDETQAQAKLTAFLPANAKLTGTYLFSRDQKEDFDNRVQNDQYRSQAARIKTHDIIVGYDQLLYQSAERSVNLQVRGNFHQTLLTTGLAQHPDLAATIEDRIDCGSECDVEDVFEEDFLGYRIGDVEFMFEDSSPGSVFNLPSRSSQLPDPIFGIPRLFFLDGIFQSNVENRNERRVGLRVDLDSQLTRVHRAKVGVEWQWIDLFRETGNLTSATFAEKYDVEPSLGAFYVQDRLDYGDLVIDLGLRWDHWDPNTVFPEFPGLVNCEISPFPSQCTEGATTMDAPTRDELAPRLGVAHPITDETQVRLSYGKFYQLPRLADFFDSYTTNFPGNPNIFYGNPNLEFVETTAFEAGITTLLTENVVLDVVGYNRDRRGAVRLEVFQPDEIAPGVAERRVFTNGDNGNVKGVDVTFSRRFSDYWSTDLAWSLQWASGTTSSPVDWVGGGGFGRLTDPLNVPELLLPPQQLQPEDFDRLHNINWQFNLRFPDNFKQGTVVGTIFENWGMFLVYNAQSGNPITRRAPDSRSDRLEDLGASRQSWIHSGDIRITKGIDIGDRLDLSVFGLVQNFLNTENWLRVHESTLLPDRSGFEDDDQARVPTEFMIEVDNEYPFSLDNIEEFNEDGIPIRSRIANQDLNGDGVVTEAEAAAILLEARRVAEVVGGPNQFIYQDDPENYGSPRTIRFGAEIRF